MDVRPCVHQQPPSLSCPLNKITIDVGPYQQSLSLSCLRNKIIMDFHPLPFFQPYKTINNYRIITLALENDKARKSAKPYISHIFDTILQQNILIQYLHTYLASYVSTQQVGTNQVLSIPVGTYYKIYVGRYIMLRYHININLKFR